MTALDTSVCVSALLAWHVAHEKSRIDAAGARIPAHALAETYSVLTRLPSPHRLTRVAAAAVLSARFATSEVLVAPVSLQRGFVGMVADAGIEGGATYDALVGLTARHHGELLLSADRRAARTYQALDVPYRLISG